MKQHSPLEAHRNHFIKLLNHGEYAKALKLLKMLLKKHPNDFEIRMQYAKVLGDWADELPPAKKLRYKKESVQILKPLIRRLRGKPASVRFSACLNYYYQTQSYLKMYRYGQRLLRSSELKHKAAYAMGLGASYRGLELYQAGKKSVAKSWGQKGMRAWKRYDLEQEKYYFAHYAMAMAAAVGGEPRQAMTHLKKAARLGKRPVSDWEFADVASVIQSELAKKT